MLEECAKGPQVACAVFATVVVVAVVLAGTGAGRGRRISSSNVSIKNVRAEGDERSPTSGTMRGWISVDLEAQSLAFGLGLGGAACGFSL